MHTKKDKESRETDNAEDRDQLKDEQEDETGELNQETTNRVF
jgi:hypothetical protein